MFTTQKFNIKKMRNLKSITSLFIVLFVSTIGISQTENKDVTITASGSGFTIEAAKQSALRSATEQAFGAFISSKTEMFNDQIIADQMSSVSSGNIKSYEVLNESELPNGKWAVTLKAIVSVDKLTSFVEAKGVAIEIKGGLFALNVKQQILNEQAEIQAVAEMVGLLHEPMQIAFDYAVKSGDPKSMDAESKNWEIPLTVTATCNKNMDFCANYFTKTLKAISLSEDEVQSYTSLGKMIFPVTVNYDGQKKIFYLRKQASINAILSFTTNWEFYTHLFLINSGIDEQLGSDIAHTEYDYESGKGDLTLSSLVPLNENIYRNPNKLHERGLSFPSAGQLVGSFHWNDKKTLNQIEQMTSYSVKPRGIISQFKHGGYVVYEENGHGLVAAIFDLGELNLADAKKSCEELNINGYSDWVLPKIDEVQLIYRNFKKAKICAGFKLCQLDRVQNDLLDPISYWSASLNTYNEVVTLVGYNKGYNYFNDVINSGTSENGHDSRLNVRPVRVF
jgi:hypothetical protein